MKISSVLLQVFFIFGIVSAQWDTIPTYQKYLDVMAKFQADYPGLCKLEEFGTSVKNRKLLAVKISDNVTTKEAEPEILYTATIHGDELCGYVLMLRLIDYLLSNYGKDAYVTKLVDNIEIWITPLLNPDGTYNYSGQMIQSIRNNANNVNLYQNFPRLPELGDSPVPEKETQAIMSFMQAHHFVMSADFHAGLEVALYPWFGVARNHPDKEWFNHVARHYADTAQANSPDGYFTSDNNGVAQAYNLFQQSGTKIDWVNHYMHCRELCIELSFTKISVAPKLNDLWNYNYRSFLNYMEQVLCGVRGTVTDLIIGNPLPAKVFINNHDKDSSFVWADALGMYYRPLFEGTYSLCFSFPGYAADTYGNIRVKNGEATTIQVKLSSGPGLLVETPNGGEIWEKGKTYNLIWHGYAVTAKAKLYKSGALVQILGEVSGTRGSYLWDIPHDLPDGNDYRIGVEGTYFSDTIGDMSDTEFSIVGPASIQKIQNNSENHVDILTEVSPGVVKIVIRGGAACIMNIAIYSLTGKHIIDVDRGVADQQSYTVCWDRKDRSGVCAPAGCYIILVKVGQHTMTKRFVFSR